jgi:hypothetical protein
MIQELEPMGGSGVQRSDNTLTAPAPMTPASLVTATTAGCLELLIQTHSARTSLQVLIQILLSNIARVVCVLLLDLHHGRLVLLNIAARRADRAGDRLLVVCYLLP